MALVRGDRDGSLDRVAWILAGFVPFFAYVATASGFAFWLDSGELLAAGVDLDIAHPPGHPLSSLVSRAFAFLPIGPLAFRVAVGQAACAAIAGMFFHRAVVTTLRAQGVRHDAVAVGTGLGASWLVTLSYGFWIQGVRPEVYALEAMVLAVVLERVVALEARWPTLDLAPLHHAGLAFGLGLANHHFMALLTVPAFLPTVVRVWRARGTRAIAISAGAVLVGLSTYVYLPLRASTAPPMDLGHPTDPSRFFWVVSARAFQSTHALESDPLAIRLMDVTVALAENLHVATLLAALAGAYVLVRADGARRIGLVWIATALFGVLGRAMLGFVSGNPDALGYLMPTLFALAALAAAFFGAVTVLAAGEADEARPPAGPSRVPLAGAALALLSMAAGVWQLREGAASASLRTFHSTDSFDGPRYRDLPTRAVVLAHGPQTVFRYFSARAIEASRPDVTVVPMPFLRYPGMIDALIDREPALAPMLRGYLFEGELRQPDLQSLAAERPLLLELDPRVPPSLLETIVPAGLLYSVEPGGAADTDVARGARVREAIVRRLEADLGDEVGASREVREQLLWLHYMDAIFFARVGAREPAAAAADRALALAPEATELRALRAALANGGEGPLDVTPFLVAEPRAEAR
jgi:hypothetical protein